MSDLPKRITRWCCQYKSCGNTELELVELEVGEGMPTLYDYVRVSNGESYVGHWMTEFGLRDWLESTKHDINP